ncbi:MAG: hypothetical protein GAK31_03712 [Stenotrophomonas maltophilia]|uniref:Uncharacterized protein n=1 Tax=Stenotrophomonas maltophilia TaxID=40324 RepID=A0A7V8JKM4_STEMA|nr:MAG: hypothetical protein GAK31_03712 [Stenotrophomonas maltophilia]
MIPRHCRQALRALCARWPRAPSIRYGHRADTAVLGGKAAFHVDDSVVNNKGMGAAVVAALVLALCAGNAQAQQAQQVQVSGTATLTSDYVWRGSTQTMGDPAAQAGIKVASHGWYASGWGSNVAFTPDNGAHTEFDLVAGWSGALSSNWSVDLNLTRYLYPGTGRRLDWTEGNATLSWRQYGWLQVAHSSDALAGGHAGTYAQLGARLPLGRNCGWKRRWATTGWMPGRGRTTRMAS